MKIEPAKTLICNPEKKDVALTILKHNPSIWPSSNVHRETERVDAKERERERARPSERASKQEGSEGEHKRTLKILGVIHMTKKLGGDKILGIRNWLWKLKLLETDFGN